MMLVEQDKFIDTLKVALGQFAKVPGPAELEAWWGTCRHYTLPDVERAFADYSTRGEADDRLLAPRPVDIRRFLEGGTRQDATKCAAHGAAGACQYPGIFGDGTVGSMNWWCPWHREHRAGPEAERYIEVSQRIPYATAMERRCARIRDQAIASPAVRDTAFDIAQRHGNRPWRERNDQALEIYAGIRDRIEGRI